MLHDTHFISEQWEYRIYLDNRASVWAVVDEVDYHWAVRWLWAAKNSKRGNKVYAYRTLSDRSRGYKVTSSLYLHVQIMERTGIVRPSEKHLVVDHRNGDSLDCRRSNLRWATRSMNRRNIYGSQPNDLIED